MRIKIKDENKMRKFINEHIDMNISNEDFNDWLAYLQDTADFIEETEKNEVTIIQKIREGASLTLTIEDNDYEVMVYFNRLVDKEGIYFEVDMNYDHFENL